MHTHTCECAQCGFYAYHTSNCVGFIRMGAGCLCAHADEYVCAGSCILFYACMWLVVRAGLCMIVCICVCVCIIYYVCLCTIIMSDSWTLVTACHDTEARLDVKASGFRRLGQEPCEGISLKCHAVNIIIQSQESEEHLLNVSKCYASWCVTWPSLSTTQLESSDWRKRTTTRGLNS